MNTFISASRKPLGFSVFNVLFLLSLAIAGIATTGFAQTTYYWDGNGATTGSGATTLAGNWGGGSASAFWGTSAVGTSATTAASLTSADTAVFAANDGVGANNYNAGYTVTLGAAQSVAGLVFNGASVGSGNTGGTVTLAGTGSPGLTIGAGGVTLNGSNGDPTFAASIGTITLGADQTWTVNAAHVWSVAAAVAGNATTGNMRTWTFGYLNAYTSTYSGVISDGGLGGALAITLNNTNGTTTGAGTNSITGVANTYTGKTTISRGVLQIASLKNVGGGSSSLGAVTTIANGTIDIGSGANTASLIYNGGVASTSDRVINLAGTTGAITISSTGATANTLTLNSNFTAASGNKTLTLRGTNTGANTINGIIGDPDVSTKISLVKNDVGRWVFGGANTYSGGTTVSGGTLSVGSGSTLGSNVAGNNIVINGGNLLLAAATNFGANQTISISSGGIGVGYTPASLPTVTDTTGATGGIYGINYTGDGAVTSLTSLYNGNWFLGSFTTGTYTGASLAAGNGSKYRIGGGGGTLTIQNNVLAGANDLLVGGTGGGSVALSNANTFTGKTTLQNGTLNVSSLNKVTGGTASSSLGAPTTVGNGTIDIGSGTNAVTLNYTGSGETTDRVLNFAGTTGGITLTNSGAGNINFNSTATFTGSGAKAIVLGTATDTYGGSIGAIVNNGGTATVTKNGLSNSTWTLTGTNTYTGDTSINGGVLSAPDTLANSYIKLNGGGSTTQAVFQAQGTIARTLSATSGAGNLAWPVFSGFAAKGGTLTLNFNAGAQLLWGTTAAFMGTGTSPMVFGSTTADNQVNLQNAVSLNTTDAFNRVIYVEKGVGGDSALISGIISQGSGVASNNGIVKDGKGTLILSNANTYGNLTTIRAGTLVAGTSSLNGSAGAFGLGTGSTGTPTAPSAIVLGEAATGSVSNNPSLLIGGAFTVGRAITVTDNGTGNAYSLGGSTDNTSTFSGAISVANGGANNNTFAFTQVATTGGNALNITGGIVGGANTNAKTLNFANVGAINVSTTAIGDGAGGGTVAVTQTGVGTTTFSAINTYTGLTTVSAGELDLNTTGGQSIAGNLTVSGGTAKLLQASQIASAKNLVVNGGTFNIQTFNQSVANVQLASGNINGSGGTLTSAATFDVQAGSVTAILGGSGIGLTKSTGGTVTLNGTESYTGATLVTSGTLVVNGTLQNGGVTVNSGATLKGGITAGGTTSILSGGTLSVGNSPGSGNFATLALAGIDIMEFNASPSRGSAGTAYDTINVSSSLTYGGELRLTFAGLVASNATTPFTLFTGVAGSGSFSSVTIYGLGGSQVGSLTNSSGTWSGLANLGYGDGTQSFSFTQSNGDLIVAVPEPATWALLAASLTTVVVFRRRRS